MAAHIEAGIIKEVEPLYIGGRRVFGADQLSEVNCKGPSGGICLGCLNFKSNLQKFGEKSKVQEKKTFQV